MDPQIWSALIGAGASLGGGGLSFFGGGSSAKEMMDFQERMFQHRYRYTMSDMRKAGLNPILAGEVGGGSTPSGAQNPAAGALGAGLAGAGEMGADLPTRILARQTAQADRDTATERAKSAKLQAIADQFLPGKAAGDQQASIEAGKLAEVQRMIAEATQAAAKERPGLENENVKLTNALKASAKPGAEADAAFYRQWKDWPFLEKVLDALGAGAKVVK